MGKLEFIDAEVALEAGETLPKKGAVVCSGNFSKNE
jgi:hypothetical protein